MSELKLNALQMTKIAEWLNVRIIFNSTKETYYLPSAEYGGKTFIEYLEDGNTILPIITKLRKEYGASIIITNSGTPAVTISDANVSPIQVDESLIQAFYNALLLYIKPVMH